MRPCPHNSAHVSGWCTSLLLAALTLVVLVVGGCEDGPSPDTHPGEFSSLLRVVAADASTQGDSTALYLRNDENPQLRTRMLALRIDFVRYDRRAGLVCMWRGGGMSRAGGYAHPLPATTPVPIDSVGEACYRTGPCTEVRIDSNWTQWTCP
ncbi:hypothetical protein [Longibacter salinarum]|uniref:hypothetical protein n=1 Tax=Longibacter salinarum TaxID=1850348 RepID=UPI00117FFAF1|nr:hypothetical protein [Longibacter salinarum]